MKTPAEERRACLRTWRTSGRLTPQARIRLFPVVVDRDDGGSAATVMRRDTGARIRTSPVGAAAIRLLQNGTTLDAVACELAAACGAEPAGIDLGPLLESLAYADMIRDIDREPFSPRSMPVSWRRVAAATIRARAFGWMVRRGPLPLLSATIACRRPPPDGLRAARIGARIAATLGRSPADADRLARRNCTILARHYVERAVLAMLPAPRLERWLTRRMEFGGHQHVVRARAVGRGVIFCGFHFGAYSLVPFLLGHAEGPVAVLVNGDEESTSAINRRVAEWRVAGYDCALEAVGGRMAIRTLAQRLKQQQAVLVPCDVGAGTAGVEWLHRLTGAPLIR